MQFISSLITAGPSPRRPQGADTSRAVKTSGGVTKQESSEGVDHNKIQKEQQYEKGSF